MKWNTKRTFLVLGILIAGMSALSVSFWLPSYRTHQDLKRFHNEFGFSLPENANIIYKKNEFGAMGDGDGLIIYQLDPAEMKKFAEKNILKTWAKLPIPKDIYTELVEKINNSSKDIANLMSLGWQNGFYFIKDRYMSYDPANKAKLNPESYKYQDFTFGVVDTDGNRVYLYRYDQ